MRFRRPGPGLPNAPNKGDAGGAAIVSGADEFRLRDEGEIARGAMGSVHLVFDQTFLRHAAKKVMHESIRLTPGATERFLEEARITGQLEHPNIVPVYDLQISPNGEPENFTMKFVEGRTFGEIIKEECKSGMSGQTLQELLGIFLKVCDALSYAHSRNVIHRDLKPENVMVGGHGQVYVMDWGIALLLDDPSVAPAGDSRDDTSPRVRTHSDISTTKGPSLAAGSPAFMAPEQTTGMLTKLDSRTDVYALGGLLYAILTGKAPRHGLEKTSDLFEKARAGEIIPPEEASPDRELPPGLSRITLRALSKRPEDRHQSVKELARDVEDFLNGGGWFFSEDLPAGTVIFTEGDPGDRAYIIKTGTCEVFKEIDGKRVSVGEMGPGEAFGEIAVLTNQPRSASVRALDDVTVMVITQPSLLQELEDRPWLGTFVKAVAARFADLDEQMAELAALRQ